MPFVHHIHTRTGTLHAELPERDRHQIEVFMARWRGLKESAQEFAFNGPTRSVSVRYCDIVDTWIEDL